VAVMLWPWLCSPSTVLSPRAHTLLKHLLGLRDRHSSRPSHSFTAVAPSDVIVVQITPSSVINIPSSRQPVARGPRKRNSPPRGGGMFHPTRDKHSLLRSRSILHPAQIHN